MRGLKAVCITMLMIGAGIIFTPGTCHAATPYRLETVYDPIEVEATIIKNAPVYVSDLTTRKQISAKDVMIKKGTAVTVKGEKNVEKKKWFNVSFSVNKKTYSGYVRNTYVTLKNKKSVTAKVIESEKERTLRVTPEKTDVVKVGKTKVTVKNKTELKLLSEKTVDNVKWYRVSLTFNKKTVKGYIKPTFIQLIKYKHDVKVYALTQAQFEKEMTAQKIPEEYKQYLRALHEDYPFWEFRAFETGLKWDTVVKNESKIGRSLISNSKSKAWKSMEEGAYDKKTGKWKILDGSTWVAASKAAVAYYMDPRNFLNERKIYMFELETYQKQYQTAAGVAQVLSNTPFAGKSFSYKDPITGKNAKISYANAFITAAVNSDVSPISLAARSKQEVVTSATTTSGAVTGKNKKYPGIYNFYNIGAYSGKNPMENGLKWASEGTTYLRPWKDQYRSIVGGATYIGSGYINKGQNTKYLEKFNVTSTDRYNHQYMTNVEAASSEADKIKKAYAELGMLEKTPLVFSIPVYKNMPTDPCPAPQ